MQRSVVRPSLWVLVLALLLLHGGIAHAQLVGCSVAATSPIAVNDDAKWPGGAVVIDVLGNDYDPDGDPFAISGFSPAANGTVQYTADYEALLYTPNGTATSDQFTYTISDGQYSSTATVYLQNEAPPPPPPPPPAQVWIEYSCSSLTCNFTAYWQNIADTPRYFHWQWDDGTTTPPNYNSRGALKALSPGPHVARVTVTFISGTVISAEVSLTVATPQHTCRFDAFPYGLMLTTRLKEITTDDPPEQFDAYQYFYDWDDGVGLRPVDPWSAFQTSGTTYTEPGIHTVNFVIKPVGSNTIVGQCPQVLEFTNEPPQPTVEASGGDGVTRPKKQFRFTPSGWDEYYNQLGPWEWNFGDGEFASTLSPTVVEHYYARPGDYTVTLKVTDSLGAVGTIDKVITVPNDPPVVSWKFNCTGRTCKFDASGSSDDSGVLTYSWNYGDGSPVETTESATTMHTFTADQAYDVVLTVSDGSVSTPQTKRVSPRGAPLAEQLLFYALPPCRVVDTRLGGRPPLNAGSLNEYVIAGNCGVPLDAKAVAINAAVVSPTQNGWLQIYPSGGVLGDTSLLNFAPARAPRADNTIAMLGPNGALIVRPAIFSAGTTHLVLDVTGYFTTELTGAFPARGPLRFDRYGDYPFRLFDSRTMPPAVSSGASRYIKARNASNSYLPVDAEAHALVVTAFNPSSGGHFILYPSDIATAPVTSAMNFQTAISQANGALMGLGRRTNDDLALFYAAGTPSTTEVAVDTYGWYAKDAKYRYTAIQPCRAIDTRVAQQGAPRLTHNTVRTLQIQGNCGVPRGAKFAVVGATIVGPDAAGSAQIGATYDPNIAAIQFAAGDIVANTVIVSLSSLAEANCCGNDFAASVNIPSGGGADLIIDVLGYFTPEANQAPAAVADAVTAVINVPITIDVLANDSDANGDAIKLSTTHAVFNPPFYGTATRASDTSITYNSTLSGTDTFDYEVIDTRGGVSHGRVTLTVRATNDPPVANPDGATTANISSVTIDALANDTDPDNDSLTLVSATTPAKGTAQILSNRILYTPNAGSSGTDTFNYTARDPFGATASAAVTITITAPNQAPHANEDSATVYVGQSVTITPVANDTDPDGDPLILSNPAITEQPSLGTAVRTSDTVITYTAGQTAGSDVFQYSIDDGRGATARGTISVTVQPTCTAPPAISAQPTSRTINTGQSTTFSVTATGGVAPLTYQWYQGASGVTTTPVGTNSNTFTVTPAATTSYWVRITNACGSTNSVAATVTVCVPPSIATQPASQSITVGTTATVSVAANGSGVTYQWYEGASGVTTTPVGTNSSSFTTPVLTANKSYWVRVTSACNGTASVDSAAADITVTCTAAPAISTQPASPTINGGQSATLTVTASAAASYQWYEGASGTTTKPVGTNSNSLSISPATTTQYWVEITNACGVTASSTSTVTVCNPPGITTQPASQSVTDGSTATLSVAAAQLLPDPKILASSPALTGWAVANVFDNNLNTDYASNGAGTGTFIDFDFGVPGRFTEVSFTDRKSSGGTNGSGVQGSGDNVTGFNLIFSTDATFGNADDVSVPVTSTACCDTVVTPIADVVARYVRYDVTAIAGGGLNIGAAELSFRAFDTVNAAGNYSYQWYEGASGTTTSPVGTNSASFTTPALSANKTYWARVTNTCNGTTTADSSAATISITCANAPALTAQPTSRTINAGQSTTITVTATSVGPATYQWYQGTAPSTTTPVGTNSNSLTVSPTATSDYWVRVTNACGSTDSVSATVTVCAPPTIATQPISQSVVVGSTATLSVVAGGSGPFTYQWYEGASGITAAPIAGATGPSYTTPALSADKSYWVRVTSTCNGSTSVNSNTATVTVTCATAPAISAQPTSRTITAGQPTTLTVSSSSVGAQSYQWYQGTAPSTTTPVGTNSASLTVSPTATTSYWVKITNACGSTNSVTATVTVCTPVSIITQPASPTITVSSTATLSVTAGGSGPFTYQWYEGASGVTTTPIAGATSSTYTTPALSANKQYWVRVTSTCNGSTSVNSNTATVTVTCATAPSITTQPTSRTINSGQPTTFTVAASGFGTLTYQWYQGTAPSTTTPVGTNSNSLTVTPGATTNYWVKVSNACGGTNSVTATVTVCVPPSIATHPVSTTINHGATATLSVAAGGSGPFTYQWYEGASGVTTTPVGTNSASFTTPALTATKSYWVRVTSTCNGSASVNSNAATVTVIPLQITRRQTAHALANSQRGITASWPQPTQAGNLLVAVISGVKNPVYLDWTPPAGWVLAVTAEWTGVKTSIYYLPNNAGGRTAETFNIAGSGYHDQILHILEYSGVMTVNPLDKTAVMEQDSSPPSGYVQTGFTANTVQPKELVITGLTVDGQGEFYSPSDGFVEIYDDNMLWHLTSATHERMTTTAWSQGHSATVTAPGAPYVGVVATFKSANTN